MMRAYQLMIMRLLLLQEHQSHDHEQELGAVRCQGGWQSDVAARRRPYSRNGAARRPTAAPMPAGSVSVVF